MNRTIFAINKNANVTRFVAQANKIKASAIEAKNKQSNNNNPLIKNGISFNSKNKYGKNEYGKRKFSTFQNFPLPPEGPDFLFIGLALAVSYFIVKKFN